MKKKLAILALATVMVCGVPADFANAATPVDNGSANVQTVKATKRKQTPYSLVKNIRKGTKNRPGALEGVTCGTKSIYYLLHKDNNNNMIIRRNIKTGEEAIIKSAKGSNYIPGLNHGNDLALASHKVGKITKYSLFVAAGYLGDSKSTKTDSLVRLDFQNNKVSKTYKYTIVNPKGKKISASCGVALVSKNSDSWSLLIKGGSNNELYYVTVPFKYSKQTKTCVATPIAIANKLNGGINQGISYKDGHTYIIYSRKDKKNNLVQNKIVKFRFDFNTMTSAYEKTYFVDTKSNKNTKFELEGLGFSGNYCYFGTNEIINKKDADSLYKIKLSNLN